MIFGRYGTFTGGINLPDEKHATLERLIEPCCPAATLRVPLAVCTPAGAAADVEVGRCVEAGQRIGRGGAAAPDVFAPLAGRVCALAAAGAALADGVACVPAVELTDLAPWPDLPAGQCDDADFDWQAAEPEALRAHIAAGALTTHRRPPVALSAWMRRARRARCRLLVANVMENQPYVTADHRLLAERGVQVVEGLAILARAIQADESALVVDHRRTGAYRSLDRHARRRKVSRVALAHKYPTGADPILVKVLTGREVPIGGSTPDVGVAVIDAPSCFAVFQWVARACRPAGRVVTLAGRREPAPRNVYVPFGTPCADLAGSAHRPVIHGGPMVGLRCAPDAVVTPSTDLLLCLDLPETPVPGPCIRCGWCTDCCPARLNVAALNDLFEMGQVDRARRAGAEACVECGTCSYVCPARLPLSQRAKQLKRTVRHLRRTMPLFAP